MASPTLETTGYPYPAPFQPQAKAKSKVLNQIISKKPIAKKKSRVIKNKKGKGR